MQSARVSGKSAFSNYNFVSLHFIAFCFLNYFFGSSRVIRFIYILESLFSSAAFYIKFYLILYADIRYLVDHRAF